MASSSDRKAPESINARVSRDPSHPDRERIDSDVRAFLRPVSTPWIVFDRDSRVDDFAKSALRAGAVFASTPSFRASVLTAAETTGSIEVTIPGLSGPTSEPLVVAASLENGSVLTSPRVSTIADDSFRNAPTASPAAVEPSGLVVAADVISPDSSSYILTAEDGSGPFGSVPAVRRRSRFARAAGASAGLLALVAMTVSFLGRSGLPAREVSAPQVAQAVAPPAPETVELDAVPTAAPAASIETTTPAEPVAKVPSDPKKRFGKLTIKADAKHKSVYLDGKRMLGTGPRSFLVFCGMHTVAVADKTDAKDIEIPCNGEYVVSK